MNQNGADVYVLTWKDLQDQLELEEKIYEDVEQYVQNNVPYYAKVNTQRQHGNFLKEYTKDS